MSTRRERQLGWVTPEQQMYAGPTPADWLDAVKRQVCPFCGAGPFTVVSIHTAKKHGIDRFHLRDMLGLTYTRQSICDPAYAQACAEMMDRKLGTARKRGSSPGPRRFSRVAKQRLSGVAADVANRHLAAVAERDAQIVRLIAQRLTREQIASEMGVSIGTVTNVARRAGLPKRPGAQPARPRRICSIEGCERVHKAHGLCKLHYRRAVSVRVSAGLQPGDTPVHAREAVDCD